MTDSLYYLFKYGMLIIYKFDNISIIFRLGKQK